MADLKYFKDKRVLITGGSSGIGKALACQLAEAGAHVFIVARRQGPLDEAVAELRSRCAEQTQRIEAKVLDISQRDAVNDAVAEILERLGGLDVVINNAGVAQPGYVQELPDDVFRSMMDINYFGALHVTRAFLPHLVAQRSGHISFVSSLVGFMGVFGYTAYAASKHAVTGFADCLRQEVREHGISVSVLFPGDTDTPQLHAENLLKPAETKAIAGNAKVMSPEAVALVHLQGIAAGRALIYPGFDAKLSSFLYRHLPGVVGWVINSSLKKARFDKR